MRSRYALVLAAVLFAAGAARADTEIGRLAVVNGEVRVAKSDSDKGRAAAPNDAVFNGDIVKTGADGAVKILFTDQSLMDVGPSSAMKVTDYALNDVENRTGTFSMLYGKLRALVTKRVGAGGKVEVRTRDAVMGVRGTEFLVDVPQVTRFSESSGTQIVVVSGQIRVTPPAGGPPIIVGAGQMLVANARTFAQAASAQAGAAAAGKNKQGATSGATTQGSAGPGGATGGTAAGSPGPGQSAGPAGAAAGGEAGPGAATGGGAGAPAPVVVSVSPDQMASMTNSVRTEDTTFVNSVQIVPSGGSTSGNQATSSAPLVLVSALTLPPPPPPGSVAPPPPPVPVTTLPPSAQPQPGNPVNLTITIH